MKQSPESRRLEDILRSSKIVAGGFLGKDMRPVDEIIEADHAALARTGHTLEEVAERMTAITAAAEKGLGTTVTIDDRTRARMLEAKGSMPCPWPHPGHYRKGVVEVTRTDTGESVSWSPLHLHMIGMHGFFEGRGARLRVDPETLARILF